MDLPIGNPLVISSIPSIPLLILFKPEPPYNFLYFVFIPFLDF
jgi:hypothetical protein